MLAALIENRIRVQENRRDQEPLLSLKTWWRDVREAADYLRQERGLHGLYVYMAVTNGMAMGYAPLLIAFFRTAQGFTTAMYSFFSVRSSPGAPSAEWSATAFPCRSESGSASCSGYIRPMS